MSDTQLIELAGRHRLIEQLVEAGLEVALPLRDHGIDLIAYSDLLKNVPSFVALPIQMKAATRKAFGIYKKYEAFPNLIHAFVWGVNSDKIEIFALTQKQAVAIGDSFRWTNTASWEAGSYITSRPGNELLNLLEPYRMTPEKWRELVTGLQTQAEKE